MLPLSFGTDVPFVRHLGFELLRFDGGESELRYEARPEPLNSHGATHGGAAMTLLDVTMARAARSVQKDTSVVTIEMKTSFLRPAKGQLTAKGRLLQRTLTMAFTEASIFDAQGRLCAHATGTFRYVRQGGAAPDDAPNPAPITTN